MKKATPAKKKKPSAKKRAPRAAKAKKESRPLVVAVGDSCFWVNNGPVVKDLRELHDAFWTMTPEQFSHHVGPERNDFAIWTMEVLADPDTANMLDEVETPEDAARIVGEALQEYTW